MGLSKKIIFAKFRQKVSMKEKICFDFYDIFLLHFKILKKKLRKKIPKKNRSFFGRNLFLLRIFFLPQNVLKLIRIFFRQNRSRKKILYAFLLYHVRGYPILYSRFCEGLHQLVPGYYWLTFSELGSIAEILMETFFFTPI